MRAKFTRLPTSVLLEYDNLYGERVKREFFVSGRYEGIRLGRVQACEGLQTRGPTLTAEDDLLAQIRKEWKKFRSNQ